MACVLAVDLGGTKICSALVSDAGAVLREDLRPTEAEQGPERALSNLLASIRAVAPRPGEEPAVALGVAAPGPLDPGEGKIFFAPNLGWRDFALGELLARETGLPVFLENDANAAALGEHLYGAGRGCMEMVFITVSTGVGGGLIIRGEIYSGAAGGAGEVGHIVVAPDGPVCSCGNKGCLEAVASGRALAARARLLAAEGSAPYLLSLAGGVPEAITPPLITEAAAAGDAVARGLLAEAGRFLGVAIAAVANILDPALFVVSGGVARGAGDFLLEPARAEARLAVFPSFRDRLRIVPGTLRGRAGVLGAAAVAWRRLKKR